jgi:tRNA_anti-like
MKKSKIIVLSLLAVALMGFTGYNYVMHGGARDLSKEEANFTVSSKSITDEFTKNIDVSNKKYLEKAVAITGIITEVTANEIIIDNTIICNLNTPNTTFKENQKVTVKGRVIGFDDLMGEIKLDQCSVI